MTFIHIWVRAILASLIFAVLPVAAQPDIGADSVRQQVEQFESDMAALRRLVERIDSAPEQDREALAYRRDERTFRLLEQLDEIARNTAKLPEQDPVRLEIQRRIEQDLDSAGQGVLRRIAELGEHIASLRTELEAASGVQMLATEAYLQSLESLRFKYYEALVDVIESKQSLGVPRGALESSLLPILYLHGETLVGRLELNGGALRELKARQAEDAANADIGSALADAARLQQSQFDQLQAMVGLLERLGEDADDYQTVLLQQGQGISIATLETGVLVGLLQDGWSALRKATVERGPDFVFRLLIFLLILLVFRYLSRLTRKLVKAACERPGVDMSTLLKDVLVSVCGGAVMVIGILMALSQVGISLGPMLTGLGIAGFVIGFALQDTLGNFAAGGMILVYRPYDVDDYVEVAGAAGLVKKMSLVSTTITTVDNQTLVIPNSKIWGDVIKNVTAQKLRRVDLVFGIGYGDDIEHAERVLAEVLAGNDKILSKPEPVIKVHELGDSSVNFVVRPWVKTEDYWDVYWDLTREVKLRFDREGITIPFPQRDVHYIPEQA